VRAHYSLNDKTIYWIDAEMGLNLRRKHEKRLLARPLESLPWPLRRNTTWSLDYIADTLRNAVNFRNLNICDDFNREALLIAMDKSLTSERGIREVAGPIAWRGAPTMIRVDIPVQILCK